MDKRDEYVFDGLDPVAEYNMLNGQHTDYYRGAGNHLALMHQYKGGTQGQMYWYHYNNKGDVVGLTKHNGNSHHNYRYDPYGAVLPENGNFTDPHNHYTLTGKEFDENTGLVWFGSRHYEPETGVWMGQDVYRGMLSEPMSLHRYGYVLDNPVTYYDHYGHWAIVDDLVAIGVGAVGGVVGQAIGDVISGELSGWDDYTASAVGGAVAAEVALYAVPATAWGAGIPGAMAAGTAGSAAKHATDAFLDNFTEEDTYQFSATEFTSDLFVDGITGGITHKIGLSNLLKKVVKINGVNFGRNSYSAISKSMFTKLKNGTIKRVSSGTLKKMFLGRFVDELPDAIFGGGVDGIKGLIEKYMDDQESNECSTPPMPGEPGFIGPVLPSPPLIDIVLPGEGGYNPSTRFA
ncbi:MAG: RHS repeat-associated core domain-containing protein [Candidatus Electrothrix sp. AUS4]|nr:RHS repeat-associated core domain-containing protein [Candidatus Electrothrix sp. AUS4]